MHSQRLNDPPLKCWIIAKPTETVISAHCLCMAGLGEACSHIGAFLFAIDHTVRHKNDDDKEGVSVTQKLCYWTPPTLKKVPYCTVDEIDFSTPQKKANILCNPAAHQEKAQKGIENVQPATQKEIEVVLQRALDAGCKSGLHLLVEPFLSLIHI